MKDSRTLTEIVGPWEEPDFGSGLIARCREAWTKPLESLSREELATLLRQKIAVEQLATLLRQKIAVEQLIPVAQQKIEAVDDDSEIYDGELSAAINYARNGA